MSEYLNFELHILEMQGGFYTAKVMQAPQLTGSALPSHDFEMPYDVETLQRILLILSGERRPRGITQQETAKEFGETLFKAVFSGEVYDAYIAARTLADQQEKGLRIRLNLSRAGNLARLPWEFLRDPEVDFLALSRSTPIVRYAKQLVQTSRLRMSLPLRILVMISDPEGLPPIDLAAERLNLERATLRLRQRGLVEIDYLEDASLRTLQRVLRQQEFHVFHYIGHSVFNDGVGTLILEDPYEFTKPYPIRGEALARELHEEDTLRMVVLNSCQGAQSEYGDPFSGVASSLVQRGMPAVVAQQYEISDKAAVIFSEEFYRAIAEGFSIEAAVAEGRRAVVSVLDNTEWATPVLFLYENNSQRIFDFPSPTGNVLLRWWNAQQRVIQVGMILLALVLIGLVFLLTGFLNRQDDVEANFPPPTATPIPDVDLVVSDVRLSPRNPKPGELVAVFVDIENRGTDPSPPFTYQWQGSIFDPTTQISKRVEGLAPGGVLHDNLTTRLGWWGVFISEARVDTQNEIIEASEQNNRPNPIRTDTTAPFVIDFNEPLPNGEFVRENQPVGFDVFASWGFRLEASADDPTCVDVVPWFKFIGISRVALGTGLPTDPNQCADETLVIIFENQRPDNNPAGISAVTVDFAPGTGIRTLGTFRDVAGTDLLDEFAGANNRRDGLILMSEPDFLGFAKILHIQIDSEDTPLAVTRLTFTAP